MKSVRALFYRKDECESVYKLGKELGRCVFRWVCELRGGPTSREARKRATVTSRCAHSRPDRGLDPPVARVVPAAARRGSFATVKLATHRKEGTKWAVKIIEKSRLKAEDEEALKMEIDILQKVEHPSIVELREVFDCRDKVYMVRAARGRPGAHTAGPLTVVGCCVPSASDGARARPRSQIMEVMSGGELFDRIVAKEKYSELEAATTMRKICTALAYCHVNKIVHRDLKVGVGALGWGAEGVEAAVGAKWDARAPLTPDPRTPQPENLLYQSPDEDAEIKVADFGLAKLLSEETYMMHTACGTPGYVGACWVLGAGCWEPASQGHAHSRPSRRGHTQPLVALPTIRTAPEILQGVGYSSAVDMWSMGVILYILCVTCVCVWWMDVILSILCVCGGWASS